MALKALGFELPKQEVLSLLQSHGSPSTPSNETANEGNRGNGAIRPHATSTSKLPSLPVRYFLDFDQFQRIMTAKILARDPREEIMRAFHLFDQDGKGAISAADLAKVAKDLGEGLHDDEVAAMIDEFDLDGDGMINAQEFMAICLNE